MISSRESRQAETDRLLGPGFYARDALEVAHGVLGALICKDSVMLRITEVEAYRWPDDSANHGRHGTTARNAALWGPAGHAYIYLCYGVHHLLNLVTGRVGQAAAVLVRSCEPVLGMALIRKRRGSIKGPSLLAGPGKVAAALGLDLSWNHHCLYRPGGLEVRGGDPPQAILAGPRVGVDYAQPRHRDARWRFAIADSAWVSHRSALEPLDLGWHRNKSPE